MTNETASVIYKHAPIMMIVSFWLFLPFSRLVEIPIALMAIMGVLTVLRQTDVLKNQRIILFTLIFASFWLPVLTSVIGAVNPERTFLTGAAFLRFYFAGIFVIATLSTTEKNNQIFNITAWLLLFLVFDSLFQIITGSNLLGYSGPEGRVNSFFGELRPELGVHLAALAPVILFYTNRYWPAAPQIAVLITITMAVFLGGSRNGWIMLLLVVLSFTVYLWRKNKQNKLRILGYMLATSVIVLSSLATAYMTSPSFADRMDSSLIVFQGDADSLNKATSRRVPIWHTALKMAADNPVNGVGARGFRYAYPDYADQENDPFLVRFNDLHGAYHPHMLLLEIAAETGLIGLTGYVLAMVILIRSWITAAPSPHNNLLPYGISIISILFPLNSYHAIYSSSWSLFLFWFVILYCSTWKRIKQ